jgi:Cyclic nucleotide-binding domain
MRIESSVTTLSWIPSEAVTGPANKTVFESGVTHYDSPPPDVIGDLDSLRESDRFRFANQLSAFVEVDDAGSITDAGYTGGCVMGSTTVSMGKRQATFQAVALPDIQREPEIGDGWVRFSQTVGGRTAIPAPRRVNHPPFVQFRAPLVWTTLELTIHTDGTSSYELAGASSFPRHWVFGPDGTLQAKAGMADFKEWFRHAFGPHTPWGGIDSPALVTEVESALERSMSATIMQADAKPKIRTLAAEQLLAEQGSPGDELYLLLDGVISVEVDGEPLVEVGPGAILGERAILEEGLRTSTLRAVTAARVAVAAASQVDREALEELSALHRREDTPAADTAT